MWEEESTGQPMCVLDGIGQLLHLHKWGCSMVYVIYVCSCWYMLSILKYYACVKNRYGMIWQYIIQACIHTRKYTLTNSCFEVQLWADLRSTNSMRRLHRALVPSSHLRNCFMVLGVAMVFPSRSAMQVPLYFRVCISASCCIMLRCIQQHPKKEWVFQLNIESHLSDPLIRLIHWPCRWIDGISEHPWTAWEAGSDVLRSSGGVRWPSKFEGASHSHLQYFTVSYPQSTTGVYPNTT